MKITQITEGISHKLFHYRTLGKMARIAKSNSFRLSPDIHDPTEYNLRFPAKSTKFDVGDIVSLAGNKYFEIIAFNDNKEYPIIRDIETGEIIDFYRISFFRKVEKPRKKDNKVYFMSLSRSPLGNFGFRRTFTDGAVTMEIDGDRLMKDGYSGKPVNYWGNGKRDEMEDRIFSDKAYIENASKYINSIHIFMNDFSWTPNLISLRTIIIWAKRNSVDINVHTSRSNYEALKKVGIPDYVFSSLENIRTNKTKKTNDIYDLDYIEECDRKKLIGFIELIRKPVDQELSDNAKASLNKLNTNINELNSVIFRQVKGKHRATLDKLIHHLQKNNIANLFLFREFILKKYKDKLPD